MQLAAFCPPIAPLLFHAFLFLSFSSIIFFLSVQVFHEKLKLFSCVLHLAPEKCRLPVDLIFAVDASGSVGTENYEKQKEFIKILASRYDLVNSSKAAVIVFSNHASNEIKLGSKRTALSFATAVDDIPYFQTFTRIDLALRLVYDEYFLTNSSNKTERIIVLLTDGKQTRNDFMSPAYVPIEETVQLLRSKSARMFAVGIGGSVDVTEMRIVTEQEDDIFLATEFNDLVAKADFIAKTTCAVARKCAFLVKSS